MANYILLSENLNNSNKKQKTKIISDIEHLQSLQLISKKAKELCLKAIQDSHRGLFIKITKKQKNNRFGGATLFIEPLKY